MKCEDRISTLDGRNRKGICPTCPSPGLSPTTPEQTERREPLEGRVCTCLQSRTWAVSAGMGNARLAVGNILIHSRIRDAFISSFICFVFIELVSCFEAQASLALHCFLASAPGIEITVLCVSPSPPRPQTFLSPMSAVCRLQLAKPSF